GRPPGAPPSEPLARRPGRARRGADRARRQPGGRLGPALGRRPDRSRRAARLQLVAGLMVRVVSPAGAPVRHWVADRIEPGAPHAVPVLSSLPGDGSLLVDSPKGPWGVHPEGS